MTVWTTFASLTGPTLPELDGNFDILYYLTNVACTTSGSANALVLTPSPAAAPISQYQQNMWLTGIALNTNAGAATAQVSGLAALPIYNDTTNGPTALTGGEIVALTAYSLIFDQALNGAAGGFHLRTGNVVLTGQTLTAAGVSATGQVSAGSLNVTGPAALASLGVTGPASLASLNVSGPSALAASVAINGGSPILRLNSTVTTVVFTALTPQTSQDQTITFSGVKLSDNIDLGWSVTPTASIIFSAFASGSGSVVMRAQNPITNQTITPGTLTVRLTQIGFT